MNGVCNRRRSLNRRRIECVVSECMEVISIGFMDPLDHPHPFVQRPAAGGGASLCLPFVMRCHLALLAVRRLLSSPCDTHHEYDNTFSAFPLLIGQKQTPPSKYSDAPQPPIGPALPNTPPVFQGEDPY